MDHTEYGELSLWGAQSTDKRLYKLLHIQSQFLIEQFNIGFADNSTFNTQHSTLPTATIQHSFNFFKAIRHFYHVVPVTSYHSFAVEVVHQCHERVPEALHII